MVLCITSKTGVTEVATFNELKNKLNTKYQKWMYERVVKGVLNTPPLQPGKLPFIALSMVHQRDVLPYLVAIKSFAKRANPQRVVIVCDPTIGDKERQIFKKHVPHVELRDAAEFRVSDIPVGGCWERLSAITEYVKTAYTVQLDADTVTTGPINEVVSAVNANKGFVIGEDPDQPLLTLDEAAELSKNWSDKHIQAFAEKRMNKASLSMNLYVRGCAGFTGFPVDSCMQEKMLDFSRKMRSVSASRWSEWGTEQITSNYLVANSNGAKVLPFPAYRTPKGTLADVKFAHFIGYVRFANSLYRQSTRRLIKMLKA